MNNFSQQPPPPAATANKKQWIILGSVIGVLVILMGGCIACGALIGLSRLTSETAATSDSNRDPVDDSRGPSSSERKTSSGGLPGTTWNGTLNCDDRDSLPVIYKFADSGNPIYEYQTKSGLRAVELTSPGQVVRFVPPGGGVTSITFDTLDVSADRISHTMRVTQESTSGGTLEQSQSSIRTEAVLSGSELEVETSIRSQSTISQPGIVAPGNEQGVVCRGKLTKQ
jgi:hypothetical protein